MSILFYQMIQKARRQEFIIFYYCRFLFLITIFYTNTYIDIRLVSKYKMIQKARRQEFIIFYYCRFYYFHFLQLYFTLTHIDIRLVSKSTMIIRKQILLLYYKLYIIGSKARKSNQQPHFLFIFIFTIHNRISE